MSQEDKNSYYEKSIDELKKHAGTANSEMGHIKESMSAVKQDIAWLKSMADKLDNRAWAALAGIGLMIVGQIILAFVK